MERWLSRTGHPRGAIVPFDQMWALVQRWYDGRGEASWRGRGIEEARAILREVGLTGEFWTLG